MTGLLLQVTINAQSQLCQLLQGGHLQPHSCLPRGMCTLLSAIGACALHLSLTPPSAEQLQAQQDEE